ncbi:hypothetical protein V5799_029624 [Amblyomma americanum]|uniref:Uncharacterized protein n=1 Tax=Amblyomma americanum TaxID=6943 RepID=A0AAQ4EQN4_AMBAM
MTPSLRSVVTAGEKEKLEQRDKFRGNGSHVTNPEPLRPRATSTFFCETCSFLNLRLFLCRDELPVARPQTEGLAGKERVNGSEGSPKRLTSGSSPPTAGLHHVR